jgi:hypothetical protein
MRRALALVGYARVSTDLQDTAAQRRELKAAGCSELHEEFASGAACARPVLAKLVATFGHGDVLVVVRIDRLVRSLSTSSRSSRGWRPRARISGPRALGRKLQISAVQSWVPEHKPANSRYDRGTDGEQLSSENAAGKFHHIRDTTHATLKWVDWFNNRRLLEPIGNIPPAEAEANYYAALETSSMAA